MAEKKRSLLIEILTLEQANNHNGAIILNGVFQKANEPNGNKRIYMIDTLQREVNRLLPICKKRALIGELDHPQTNDPEEGTLLHMSNASHIITDLMMKENLMYGSLELLDTPKGIIAQEFVKKKVKIGVSSRALGSVIELGNGFLKVDNDLEIITWDLVVGPSVSESELKNSTIVNEWKILTESLRKKLITEISKKNMVDEKKNLTKQYDPDYIRYLIRKELKNI